MNQDRVGKLSVKTIGQGSPIIFIHGWGLNHAVWMPIVSPLQQQYKLSLVDLPGHGSSSDIADYSLHNVSSILSRQFDQACTVVAWSMGGLFALKWAANTNNIKRLILVAGTPQFYRSDDWPHAIDRKVLDEFGQNLQNDYQQTLRRFLSLQSLGSKEPKKNIRLLRQSVLDQGQPSQSALNASLKILKTTNLRPLLDQVHCPVYLIQGEKDILVPALTATYLAKVLPIARYVIIEQASHAPFLSHQNVFLTKLMAFLAEND